MQILALAIYNMDIEEGAPFQEKRIKHAQKASFGGLFSFDELKSVEDKVLPVMLKDYDGSALNGFQQDNNFYYLKKYEINECYYFIQSDRKLEVNEVGYLFHNMQHVHLREDKIGASLKTMLDNPLNYIGKDAFVLKLGGDLTGLKDLVMNEVKTKLIMRGENLDSLLPKTIELDKDTKEFEERGKKLNKKCCPW